MGKLPKVPTISMLPNYEASYRLLCKDTMEVMEFVEPTDANLAAYSHRIYGLLLRICTDVEGLLKELFGAAKLNKPAKKRNLDIHCYKLLEPTLRLEIYSADFAPWRPKPRRLKPFENWSRSDPPLPWYADYNRVKHNRNTDFSRANLGNLVLSLSGLFVLLLRASPPPPDTTLWRHSSTNDNEQAYWSEPFWGYRPDSEAYTID